MKICAYCGTANPDSALLCKACGAGEFKNNCNNCGTVFESNFCPTCGTKAGAKPRVCPRCSESHFTPACPRCGYVPGANKGAEPAKPRPQVVVQPVPVVQTIEKEKKKITFGTVLLWIFFWPVMAVVAAHNIEMLKKACKLFLAVIISMIILGSYVCSI